MIVFPGGFWLWLWHFTLRHANRYYERLVGHSLFLLRKHAKLAVFAIAAFRCKLVIYFLQGLEFLDERLKIQIFRIDVVYHICKFIAPAPPPSSPITCRDGIIP